MVPVVEGPPVDECTYEVPGVIILVIRVAAVMLDKVDANDSPGSVGVRDKHVEQELLPVDDQKDCLDPKEENCLNHHLIKPRGTLFSHRLGVVPFRFNDRPANNAREQQLVQEIPAKPCLCGAHDVFSSLRMDVVTQIVAWHIGAYLVTVGKRQQHLKYPVKRAAIEHRYVNRVVRNHRTEKRKYTDGRNERYADPP